MSKPALHRYTEGYDAQSALSYRVGRPSYPKKAVDVLVDAFGLTHTSHVCDLAAGTGKLTKPLVKYAGCRVTAVEPVEAMRAEFAKAVPGTPVVEGAAERIPFPAGTFDLVTVAQAFHWFDIPRAQKEIRRVLRRRGGLAILWSHREALDWARKLDAIIHRHYGGHPYGGAADWQATFARSRLFERPLEMCSVRHVVRYTPARLLTCVFSVSAIALLDAPRKKRVEREVLRLFETHPDLRGRDTFALPHQVRMFWTRAT